MLRATAIAASCCLLASLALAQTPSGAPAPKTPAAPATPAPSSGPVAGAPASGGAAYKPMTVKDVMRLIVNPAAETYWQAGGEVDTEAGRDKRTPTTDEKWNKTLEAGATIQEAGNLLLMPGRGHDNDATWMRFATELANAGAEGVKAARDKSEDATFAAGSSMYDACFNCHGRYIPRPANSLYKQP